MFDEFPAWDPVLIEIPGLPIDIRWYGLMYVAAFVVGQIMLTRMARSRFLPVDPQRVPDLILYLVFGVLLGGRLGFALFYDPDLLNPIQFIQLWKGGLSFHGGLLGVLTGFVLFARKHGTPRGRLADACAIATCPGIFFVRWANFINGELYGRVTEPLTFGALRFPTDEAAMHAMGIAGLGLGIRHKELCIQVAYGHRTWESVQDQMPARDLVGRTIDWEAIRPRLDWDAIKEGVPFRHPSQLYEGLGEGLLLGTALLVLLYCTRRRPLGHGFYGGVFLVGYGVVRFFIEYLREPDAQFRTPGNPGGTVFLGMTMGQTLCVAMILAGIALLRWSCTRVPEPVPVAEDTQ